MRKIQFNNQEIYHVFNRGVDRRKIFLSDADRRRFVKNLTEACPGQDADVEVLAYCLLDNHYHLLIRQIRHGGISKFMHKIGMGYSLYFNKTHGRTGKLYESSFKAVHVKMGPHYLHAPRYIHLNVLDVYVKGWRDNGIHDIDEAMKFLDDFEWCDFSNKSWSKQFLIDLFGSIAEYRKFLTDWMKYPAPALSA